MRTITSIHRLRYPASKGLVISRTPAIQVIRRLKLAQRGNGK